jgi:hypothetical protein
MLTSLIAHKTPSEKKGQHQTITNKILQISENYHYQVITTKKWQTMSPKIPANAL